MGKQKLVDVTGWAPATVGLAPEIRTAFQLVPDHQAQELHDGHDQLIDERRLVNAFVVHPCDAFIAPVIRALVGNTRDETLLIVAQRLLLCRLLAKKTISASM